MSKTLTTNAGCPVVDNQNAMTAGPRGPQLLQDVGFLEKLAHFDREVIPERDIRGFAVRFHTEEGNCEERHLHMLAKRGTPLEDLPEASLLQKTDFIPATQRGLALAGAGVGAWRGGMVGMNVGNTRLRQFADAIEGGALLVMADVPRDRVEEIEARVTTRLPAVEIHGTEPTIPPFP